MTPHQATNTFLNALSFNLGGPSFCVVLLVQWDTFIATLLSYSSVDIVSNTLRWLG